MGSHTLRVTSETYELVSALAYAQNRPMGEIVFQAVEEYLAAEDQQTKQFVANALQQRKSVLEDIIENE